MAALCAVSVSVYGAAASPPVAPAELEATLDTLAELLPSDAFEMVATALNPPLPGTWKVGDRTSGIIEPEGMRAAPDAVQAMSVREQLPLLNVAQQRLGPLDVDPLLAQDVVDSGAPARIGVGREAHFGLAQGTWREIHGKGWLWALDIVSAGAKGIRVHFANVNLIDGANLVVHAPSDPSSAVGPFEGRGPGDFSAFWTPTIFDERVRIEYFVPSERAANRQEPAFIIDRLQHQYRTVEEFGNGILSVLSCHNNVACYGAWGQTAKAVGRIAFVSGGDTYMCTGQLLATNQGDFTPYFLTAHHCVSTSFEAQSAEVFWLYQSDTCNGSAPPPSTVPRSSQSTLVKAGAASDYCLLMIEGALPNGLTWAGWDSTPVVGGTALTCIHHPDASYKRISFGYRNNTQTCSGSLHYGHIKWYSGKTQGGSSGGGIFMEGTRELVGQLYGSCVASSCNYQNRGVYGAFSSTYPNIASYLIAGSDDAFESNDSCTTARSVSAGIYNDHVVKSADADWYKIAVPAGKRLKVKASFTHVNGDIDLKLFKTCGGSVVKASHGVTNAEYINVVNNGAGTMYYLKVYLYSDTRNTYDMTVTITDP